jgi:TPP-dependent pyruvate/acetoin dehydrogenase alpha subunit
MSAAACTKIRLNAAMVRAMEELRSLSDELEALMREGAVSDGLMKDAGQEDAKVTKTVKLACASYREILQRAHPVKKE